MKRRFGMFSGGDQPRRASPGQAQGAPPEFFVDVHCHCLPGLDDGPEDLRGALALCEALAADQIATVVATPHQLGRYDGRYRASEIRQAVARLNRCLREAGVPLTVVPGADVRLDERIAELLQSDEILTAGDNRRYLMLELPHEVFVDPSMLMAALAQTGVGVVVTHPERHSFLAQNPQYVRRWGSYAVALQITAASFLGEFGRCSEQAAWNFLYEPLPLLVATDAHDTVHRPPRMTEAYHLLAHELGSRAADVLCLENPRRLLAGQDLLRLDR
jgi:protein-tyrosine phosphatase